MCTDFSIFSPPKSDKCQIAIHIWTNCQTNPQIGNWQQILLNCQQRPDLKYLMPFCYKYTWIIEAFQIYQIRCTVRINFFTQCQYNGGVRAHFQPFISLTVGLLKGMWVRVVSEAALWIHQRLLLVRLCAERCVGAGGQPEERSVTPEKYMNSVYREDQNDVGLYTRHVAQMC